MQNYVQSVLDNIALVHHNHSYVLLDFSFAFFVTKFCLFITARKTFTPNQNITKGEGKVKSYLSYRAPFSFIIVTNASAFYYANNRQYPRIEHSRFYASTCFYTCVLTQRAIFERSYLQTTSMPCHV